LSKPVVTCPECKSKNVAWIQWGFVEITESLERELDQGKITLGGCCVSDNDPKWECNDCYHRWGERDDS